MKQKFERSLKERQRKLYWDSRYWDYRVLVTVHNVK